MEETETSCSETSTSSTEAARAWEGFVASRATSQRKGGRTVGSASAPPFASGKANGLWPSVMASHVTPQFWIDDAWLTARQTVLSAEAKALRRPSGRPMARRAPRVTRWVCR